MSSPRFETFLARLYSDRVFLQLFLEAPARAGAQMGLDEHEQRAALTIDRVGLRMAARSYAFKRAGRLRPSRFAIWRWLLRKPRRVV